MLTVKVLQVKTLLISMFVQLLVSEKLAKAIQPWEGHSAMERLFSLMNFLPVMGKDSFHEMNKEIAGSYSKVAKECMLEAANELHPGDPDLLCNAGVSCDGT